VSCLAQSQDYNYISTKTYLDDQNYMNEIEYYNGIGQPIETSKVKITPTGFDLVTKKEYDGFGRRMKTITIHISL